MKLQGMTQGFRAAALLCYAGSLAIWAGLFVFYHSMIRSAHNMMPSGKKLWGQLKKKYERDRLYGKGARSAKDFAEKNLARYRIGVFTTAGWKKAARLLSLASGLVLLLPCLLPLKAMQGLSAAQWMETCLRTAAVLTAGVFLYKLVMTAVSLPERETELQDCMEEYLGRACPDITGSTGSSPVKKWEAESRQDFGKDGPIEERDEPHTACNGRAEAPGLGEGEAINELLFDEELQELMKEFLSC